MLHDHDIEINVEIPLYCDKCCDFLPFVIVNARLDQHKVYYNNYKYDT